MIEIGMPFSDPLADGPVIQKSSETALHNGMNTKLLFRQLSDIRKTVDIPLLLMGYLNPVLKFGMENFCTDVLKPGLTALSCLTSLRKYYLDEFSRLFEKYKLFNIFLITPQANEERIRIIDSVSNGFVYLVSSNSITGIKRDFTEYQTSYFKRIREMKLKNPGLIGFGISDRQILRKPATWLTVPLLAVHLSGC